MKPRDLVESVARRINEAVRTLDGRRFLGALRSSETYFEEVLDRLERGDRERHRALFCDPEVSPLDRAVFLTWFASEWAYFSWVADEGNFWPRLLVLLGVELHSSANSEIYRTLDLGFAHLALENHLADSKTGWRYVESLRRQSGFPRRWWERIHEIVRNDMHLQDVRGDWAARLREQQGCWSRSFRHAAREFPEEVHSFFDAVRRTIDTGSAEPLRNLDHAFAREPDALAEYLLGGDSFHSYVAMQRSRRAQRRQARMRHSSHRFWIESVEVGIGAFQTPRGWSVGYAAYLPRTIPRESLPAEMATATALALSARTAGTAPTGAEVRYDSGEAGFRALQPDPLVVFHHVDGPAFLSVRAALRDSRRSPVLDIASLLDVDESQGTFYRADLHRRAFYVPVPASPDDRIVEVPEGHPVLLVLKFDADVLCDVDPLETVALGSVRTVRVFPPPSPVLHVRVGNEDWKLQAKPPLPGDLLLDGPRLGAAVGERTFTSWPSLRWEASRAVQLHSLDVVPVPSASNAGRVRHLVNSGVTLDPGRPQPLDDLTFAVDREPPSRLPREFIGRALLRMEIGQGKERWRLAASIKLLPQTEIYAGDIEAADMGRLPLHVSVRGVETLRLTACWELTTGAVAADEYGETRGRGDELNLDMPIAVRGLRLICRLRYGFREELPPDLDPSFAVSVECPLPQPMGYLIDESVEPTAVRPLGSVLRFGELVTYSIVLADQRSDGAQATLILGEERLSIPWGRRPLAHVRQQLGALLRRRQGVTVFLDTAERLLPLFTVLSEELGVAPEVQLAGIALQELVRHESRHPDRDTYGRELARAVLEGLLCAVEHSSWAKCWRAVARTRLRDFTGWAPSSEIVAAYDELGGSGTRIALPWLRRSWGLVSDADRNDLPAYPRISRLVERLERLGRDEGFAFLPALLAAAQDLGPDAVLLRGREWERYRRGRERMRYLILMLCTGCPSSTFYRARSFASIPKYPSEPPDMHTPWWAAKPEDLRYPLAWELFRIKLDEPQLRALKACQSRMIDLDPSIDDNDADQEALDLTGRVIDIERDLRKARARPVVLAALVCSQEWARYVVRGDDARALDALLDAFLLVCEQAPVLTRALCIDAVLREMDRHDVGVPEWDADANDGQAALNAFPEFWKYWNVRQVL